MALVVGFGRKARETYPEAPRGAGGSGAVVRMGFDNSEDGVNYTSVGGTVPILRLVSGAPLQVVMSGYTKGNLLLIQFSVSGEDGIASGPSGSIMVITPTVNIGGGPRTVHGSAPTTAGGFAGGLTMPPNSWTCFVVPVPSEVTADPIIGLLGSFAGSDATFVFPYSALLCVSEINAASIVQLPTMFLDP